MPNIPVSRRSVLSIGGGLALAAAVPRWSLSATPDITEFRLTPRAAARVALVGAPHPKTEVWSYNGGVPGPEIRVKQGSRLKIIVENRLKEDTTVHWHGLRVPFKMDGVSHLT
jgi:FtsP/CotA-like multicopper oxidase with cupredoxin domain